MFNYAKRRRGFTLIELLVVIAIIGILASLIIVSLSGARQKANDTTIKNNARNIDTALAQYYLDNGSKYVACGTATGCQLDAIVTTNNLGGYLTASTVTKGYANLAASARYGSDLTANATKYAQAWQLNSSTEAAILSGGTIIPTGNGVYGVNAAAVTFTVSGTNVQVQSAAGMANPSRMFVTFGPQ